MGTLVTNFQLIKAGALHKAIGGYLVLDARKLLTHPFAYEGLKRALQSRELRLESLGQAYSLVSTVSLDPEPIPIAVKVVLVGERLLHYMLQALDPEFSTLFKVAADFEDEVERSEENTRLYARLLATLAKRASLKPLDRQAVDGEKLSARIRPVSDIIQEADFCAAKAGSATIDLRAVSSSSCPTKWPRHDRIWRGACRSDRQRWESRFRGIENGCATAPTELSRSAGSRLGAIGARDLCRLCCIGFARCRCAPT